MNGTTIDTMRLAKRLPKLDQKKITQTRPGIRIIELPDTLIRIRVAGEGKTTIVFACDPPNVVEQFDEIIDQLTPDYRVLCYEHPGFGFSFPKSGFDFTLPAYAQALTTLLKTLNLGPYVLVHPCWATYYGMKVASESPELIQKLVLMQATSWEEEIYWSAQVAKLFFLMTLGIPRYGNKLAKIPYLGQMLLATTERWFPQLTHPYAVYQSKRRPKVLAKFMEPGKLAFQQGACNCMVSMYQQYWKGDDSTFPKPKQPTLVLWANRDIAHDTAYLIKASNTLLKIWYSFLISKTQSNKKGLLKYVPHALFKEIEGAGHHLELESPEQVCQEIRAFINSKC